MAKNVFLACVGIALAFLFTAKVFGPGLSQDEMETRAMICFFLCIGFASGLIWLGKRFD